MKADATAPAGRTPRTWWFDPRFAIGLGLVAVSVLGVLWIVSAADRSVSVYAARAALSPGDRIRADDLTLQSVRLGGLDGRYLARRDLPADGLVATRAVAAGELVPVSAVGSRAGTRFTSVVVEVKGQLARAIEADAVVDLWSAAQTEDRGYGPPAVLVSSATVVRIIKPDGIAAGGGDSVEVLVPRTATARVLEAVANEDAISLVPSGIPAKD